MTYDAIVWGGAAGKVRLLVVVVLVVLCARRSVNSTLYLSRSLSLSLTLSLSLYLLCSKPR
jgi:hypothetical protein